jgi:hypothetical protein
LPNANGDIRLEAACARAVAVGARPYRHVDSNLFDDRREGALLARVESELRRPVKGGRRARSPGRLHLSLGLTGSEALGTPADRRDPFRLPHLGCTDAWDELTARRPDRQEASMRLDLDGTQVILRRTPRVLDHVPGPSFSRTHSSGSSRSKASSFDVVGHLIEARPPGAARPVARRDRRVAGVA